MLVVMSAMLTTTHSESEESNNGSIDLFSDGGV